MTGRYSERMTAQRYVVTVIDTTEGVWPTFRLYGPLAKERAREQVEELTKAPGRQVLVLPLERPPIDEVGG